MSRPFECNSCKKPICVFYKEIAGDSITQTEMCKECPILEKKLNHEASRIAHTQDLTCHCCRTKFSDVRMGSELGCPDCYNAFEDLLVEELKMQDLLPASVCGALQTQPKAQLHQGKGPEMSEEVPLPQKLQEMNQALNRAVGEEKFEEAAFLRDQIKSLMEKRNGK